MRLLPALMTLALLLVISSRAVDANAGPNADTTIPLHAVVQSLPPPPPPCDIPDPCPDPLIEVETGAMVRAYLLVRNYEDVGGVQTAFDWGDWTFLFGSWNCQSNQIVATAPGGKGGPFQGTIATVFDCIVGGSSEIVGYMQMISGTGCMTQVESSFPDGTHVINCAPEPTAIAQDGRGSICVGQSGVDACLPGDNGPGPNRFATLVMHGVVLRKPPPEPCDIADPCDPGPPQVSVPPNTNVTAYVMLRNYDNVALVQTAFDWDDWSFVNGVWSCLPGQVTFRTPSGNGGPVEGILATDFDCATGGETIVVGSMNFIAAGQGCLTQVEPAVPDGLVVSECDLMLETVRPEHLGSICVGPGGVDTCDPVATPVESASWGAIKSRYRR